MKPFPDSFNPLRRPRATRLAAAALALAMAHPALAADVTLTATNDGGTSSFNSALSWSSGAAPAAGNAYFVPTGFNLRTPASSTTDYTFAGDSLTLTGPNANLVYKGSTNVNTITVNNLTLNGALVNNASNSSTAFILGGGITVAGTGTSTLFSNNASITVTAPIGGNSGTLLLQTNDTTGRQVILSGANTYTGTIQATGASGAVLASTGSLAFAIGASGVNNTITGTAPFTFDGAFNIDLTNAGDTVGDSWTLVNVSTLGETFGGAFTIPGFTENENIWTSASGEYQFLEATGVLSRIEGDTDGDGMRDSWEIDFFENLSQTAGEDADGDLANNLLEYLNESDPTDTDSFPDTDLDGLNDGWELHYFNNSLARDGTLDFDNDFNSDAVEFAAGSAPNSSGSYPDADEDGLNDGWEVYYFTDIESAFPDADPDEDLFTNYEELVAGTDPTVQFSSPDTDIDGLPDGWEVRYFRGTSEDLATVIAHYGILDDPDNDGLTNKLEYLANTDPSDSASGEKTLGYWRFEEATSGEVPAGANNAYGFPTSVQDSSAYGNHMMAWATYSRPNYDALVPAPLVPATDAANAGSLFFQRNNNGVYYIEAIFSTPTAYLGGGEALLRTHTFSAFTIEASFNTTLTNTWQVPVSKLGNPVAGQPPFSLKIDPSSHLRAGIVDGSGTAREIISTTAIQTGSWYSAAVTATATELKLWIKGPGNQSYVLAGQTTISGAWYVPPSGTPLDTPWNIGQGMWNNVATDAFQGNVDEVRISAMALDPEEFLFFVSYETWAEQNISDEGQRAEADDADGDGTSNLVEYLLGLEPDDGTSFFYGSWDGTTLTWPAASGLSFVVQRSTSLLPNEWEDVATVLAAGTTATWIDPAPPAGKAFYRAVLDTD